MSTSQKRVDRTLPPIRIDVGSPWSSRPRLDATQPQNEPGRTLIPQLSNVRERPNEEQDVVQASAEADELRLSSRRTADDRGVVDHALTKSLNEAVRVPPRLDHHAVANGDPVAGVFALYFVAGHSCPFPYTSISLR